MISFESLIGLVIAFGFLMIAMTFHEFAHGWAAYKLGDPTAKYSGRFTLNPLAHIDLFGTIIMPLVLFLTTNGRFIFGYAKPVPVNFAALRNPKRDMIWVGLAGPTANILLAAIFSFIIKLFPGTSLAYGFIGQLIFINVLLAVFNLIPIPPLDGSRVVMGLLPRELAVSYAAIEPFGFIIVLVLVATGAFSVIISPIIDFIMNLLRVL